MARSKKTPEEPVEVRPLGRPTYYDPSFCEKVVEYGKQGMSLVEIASELDVSRASLYDWAQQYPEFSTCLTRAREESQAWWERIGRLGVFKGDDEIDSNLWFRNVTKRFRKDWGETKDPEVDSGDIIDAKPIPIEADKLPAEKRELLTQLLLELKQIAEEEGR